MALPLAAWLLAGWLVSCQSVNAKCRYLIENPDEVSNEKTQNFSKNENCEQQAMSKQELLTNYFSQTRKKPSRALNFKVNDPKVSDESSSKIHTPVHVLERVSEPSFEQRETKETVSNQSLASSSQRLVLKSSKKRGKNVPNERESIRKFLLLDRSITPTTKRLSSNDDIIDVSSFAPEEKRPKLSEEDVSLGGEVALESQEDEQIVSAFQEDETTEEKLDQKPVTPPRELLSPFSLTPVALKTPDKAQIYRAPHLTPSPARKSLFGSPSSTASPTADARMLTKTQVRQRLSKSTNLADLRARLRALHEGTSAVLDKAKVVNKSEEKSEGDVTFVVPERTENSFGRRKARFRVLLKTGKEEHQKELSDNSSRRQAPQLLRNPRDRLSQFAIAEPQTLEERPQKSSPIKRPAPPRTPPSPGSCQLLMPFQYKLLLEVFRCLDHVVHVIASRGERVLLPNVKAGVQRMLRRVFSLKYLAQIKAVYPEAYSFAYEKGVRSTDSPDFVITLPKRDEESPESLRDAAARLSHFRSLLLDRLRTHHTEFLKSLDPPIELDLRKVRRWHPDFPLDEIPPIEEAPLPKPEGPPRITNADQLLDRVRQALPGTRLAEAMERVANQKKQEAAIDSASVEVPTATETLTNGREERKKLGKELRGISMKLLAKVRAREATRTVNEMTRSDEDAARLDALQRLPEMARITRGIFLVEKKPALPVDLVVNKVHESYRGLACRTDVEQHLEILCKEAPNFISRCVLRIGVYYKINKNVDLNAVCKLLNERVQNFDSTTSF
ncbi:unnamed protein product [Cyprideis torosa]|uniref:Uncharacterized protein n=1 Tax=Cyprideis torosa TaxID=163714 RepID=A0A7R8W2X9_9CRUS|nr:unnamed protein product [Cyprideis torosa]CAG0881533.1 unnamed protein product [Cyprideis torosa]